MNWLVRRRAAILVAVVLAASLSSPAPRTLAFFTSAGSVSGSLSSLAVASPTNLAAAGGATATLTWTPTVTSRASGYYLFRSSTSGSGYTQVGSVAPASVAATTDAPASGTWYYVLQAYAGAWTSGYSNQASVSVVRQPVTTPVVGCDPTMQAALPTGSGDGYEITPGNACAADGAVAKDLDSPATPGGQCASSSGDRHRFWGYVFGLPASVTSINGITVNTIVGDGGEPRSPSACGCRGMAGPLGARRIRCRSRPQP